MKLLIKVSDMISAAFILALTVAVTEPSVALCSSVLRADSLIPTNIQLSKSGTIFAVETLNTFPSSQKENNYYVHVGPPVKFGDFSLTYSSSENKQDGYNVAEVDRSSFTSWLIQRNMQEGPPGLYVPDNKPVGYSKVAFNGFFEYFPLQYFRPLMEDGANQFLIAQTADNPFKGGIDTLFGTMNLSLLGQEELELNINGTQQRIRCVKVLQEATLHSYNLDEGAAKNIIYTFKRTYWVLENRNDPLILKQEGYRTTTRHQEDHPYNGFKYIENLRITAITQ